MLKKIAIVFLVLILLAVGAGQYLWSNLDSIAKAAIEKYGSAAVQSDVKLDKVKLSLTTGEGMLSGLSVANPKGFSQPKAIYLGTLSVKLDTNSIMGKGPITIREIVIEKPQVTYEVNQEGHTNLQALQQNTTASASAPDNKDGSGKNTATGNSGKKSSRKIIIDDLYIREGQVSVNQDLLPDKSLSVPLPMIHLSNIGKQQNGATTAQVAQQILGSITAASASVANSEISKTLGNNLKDAVGKNTGDVGTKIKGLLGR